MPAERATTWVVMGNAWWRFWSREVRIGWVRDSVALAAWCGMFWVRVSGLSRCD